MDAARARTRSPRGLARLSALTACLAIGATACAPPLTPSEQATVDRYLVCYECEEPLQDVRTLATSRPQATVDSLNAALRSGPAPALAASADSLLNAGYGRDSAWRVLTSRAPLGPRATYVAQAYERYADGYRGRGALALGWIRTPRALSLLDDAIANGHLPPSVLGAAKFARDSLATP